MCSCRNFEPWLQVSSMIPKAHKTYQHVFEGTDVGVLWFYVVEETRLRRENHQPWMGNHNPATCRQRESIQERSGDKRGFSPALSRPQVSSELSEKHVLSLLIHTIFEPCHEIMVLFVLRKFIITETSPYKSNPRFAPNI